MAHINSVLFLAFLHYSRVTHPFHLTTQEAETQRAEIRIAKTAIANVSLWLLCWTPYALITLQGVMGNISGMTPLITTLPALLAKSCSCYNPFVYAISHPKYRLVSPLTSQSASLLEEYKGKPSP